MFDRKNNSWVCLNDLWLWLISYGRYFDFWGSVLSVRRWFWFFVYDISRIYRIFLKNIGVWFWFVELDYRIS